MKLHFAPQSRAVRILWLCRELGIEPELVRYTLGDPAMRAPEHLARHPLGRVPVLEDDGVVIYETGAIIHYVLERHGGGRLEPAAGDWPARAMFLQWLHFAEGMIMSPINTIVVETILLPPDRRNPGQAARARKLLNRTMEAVERHLEGRTWLAGEDFTAADVQTGHAVMMSMRLGADERPNMAAYRDRLLARPACASAFAEG